MERLEEAGALRVETTEREVAQLLAQLVGEHEAGIDDLAILAVTELAAVAGARDRVLDRPDDRRDRARLVVVETVGEAETRHAVLPQRVAHDLSHRVVGRVGRPETVDLRRLEPTCERADRQLDVAG